MVIKILWYKNEKFKKKFSFSENRFLKNPEKKTRKK